MCGKPLRTPEFVREEVRRPLRLRTLFRGRPALAAYRGDDLRTPGWEAAGQRTSKAIRT